MARIRSLGFPSNWRYLRPHLAVDKIGLAEGKTVGINPRQQAL
jgi:hypothetical protein